MLSIRFINRRMKLNYEIVTKDGKRFVYLSDVPQYLDLQELGAWMREVRDDNPDLYAELVCAYVKMTLPCPTYANPH